MPRFTATVCLLLAACQEGSPRPSPADYVRPIQTTEPDRPDGAVIDAGNGCGAPPPGDFCGQTFLREVDDPPNLYFVVDRSASMGDPFEGSSVSKYYTARASIVSLLRSIGHRVRYGAATFPAQVAPDTCTPGQQIFPTVRGDPVACAAQGRAGPVLSDLSTRLASIAPDGSTPTSATLEALRPTLTELGGTTSVVLVTDGAPNCNFDALCDVDECTLNIERVSYDGRLCDASYNCCDPANTGSNARGYCADIDASEASIVALADEGIQTFVIGMPGAEQYGALLDRLAVAGGTARGTGTDYYAVGDADELEAVLHDIGTGIAISCSIDLEEAPEDPARVNVYFDGEVVPADDADGWAWDGEQRIEVRGAPCDLLRSGEILEARVVFGCDTVVR